MATKITIEITLGNDLMQDPMDVAQALQPILERMNDAVSNWDEIPTIVRDFNGARVGTITVH